MADGSEALERLLIKIFSEQELRQFLRRLDSALVYADASSLAVVAHHGVADLQRRGWVGPELFDRLLAERPERRAEILEVQARCSNGRGATRRQSEHELVVEVGANGRRLRLDGHRLRLREHRAPPSASAPGPTLSEYLLDEDDERWLRTVLGSGAEALPPQDLRIRLAGDHEILGPDWSRAGRSGSWWAAQRWTVELTPRPAATTPYEWRGGFRVGYLHGRNPALNASEHRLAVEDELRACWPGCNAPKLVGAELVGAGLIYVHAAVQGGRLDVDGAMVSVGELLARHPRTPVYFNLVGDLGGLGPTMLAGEHPLVVLQTGPVATPAGRLAFLRFLRAVYRDGNDPVAAVHDLALVQPLDTRLVAITAYSRWLGPPPNVSPRPPVRVRLDRTLQRALAHDAIRKLAQNPQDRVGALVLVGAVDDEPELLALQIKDHVEREDRSLELVSMQLGWPEAAPGPGAFRGRLADRVGCEDGVGREAAAGASRLGPAVRRWCPEGVKRPIVLVNWKSPVVSDPAAFQRELGALLKTLVEVARGAPRELRVMYVVAVAAHDVEAVTRAMGEALDAASGLLLPDDRLLADHLVPIRRPERVLKRDVLSYLGDASGLNCPAELRLAVAARICPDAGRPFTEVVEQLERVEESPRGFLEGA